jgi:hypothetical protein
MWACLIFLLIWLFLKDIGVINTPIFVQALPYMTVFGFFLVLAREAGKYAHKIDRALADIKEMRRDIHEVRLDIANLDKRVAVLEARA